jgi:exopolysaccharide biosynthesis WecB/TagA/CpsF family protein
MNINPNFAALASRRMMFNTPICDLGWSGTLAFVNDLVAMPVGQTVIAFLNANNANYMMTDPDYRAALSHQLVLPDGIGMDIASQVMHGDRFPANLNGTDFVPALLTYIDQPKRIGLIGGRPNVLATAAANLRKHAPWHEFIAVSDGFFDKNDSSAVIAEIERQDLDILIVGMGTPIQEKWVRNNICAEHARLVITVGALFDFVSGTVPRAPMVVRRLRLEWLFRMCQEPTRLWKRYVLGIPQFMSHVMRYRSGGRDVAIKPTVIRLSVARSEAPAANDEQAARKASRR